MDLYHVVLFIHIVTLLAAISASTLAHFIMFRVEGARTAAEARQWFVLLPRITKVFPAAILTFFVTGGYMVTKNWSWQVGFVQVGAIGALLLLVNGIIMGVRTRPLAGMLQNAGNGPVPAAAHALIHGGVVHTLPWVNTMIAVGVVFVMTMKPALPGSLLSLGLAIGAGLLLAARFGTATERAAATERA